MNSIPMTKERIIEYLLDLDEEIGLKNYQDKLNFVIFGAAALVLLDIFERNATYDIDIIYKAIDKSSFGIIENIIELEDDILNSRGFMYVGGILEYEDNWYELEYPNFTNIKILFPSLEMLCVLKLGAAVDGRRYDKDMNDISTKHIKSKVDFKKVEKILKVWTSYEGKEKEFEKVYNDWKEK